jgi:hypothetical protein
LSHEKRISKMPNLIRWTQTVLEGSKIVLFFKLFKKMKMNQKFAKKAMIVASLTAGVIGFNSIFNEVQASGGGQTQYILSKCYKKGGYNGLQCTASSLGNCSNAEKCN